MLELIIYINCIVKIMSFSPFWEARHIVSFSKLAFYHAVDNMKPEDVGLSSELQFFRPTNVLNGDSRVTYTTIYKCDNFSVRLACSALVGSKYSFCMLHELKIRLMNHPVTFLPKKKN